jgi:hypothetical protein
MGALVRVKTYRWDCIESPIPPLPDTRPCKLDKGSAIAYTGKNILAQCFSLLFPLEISTPIPRILNGHFHKPLLYNSLRRWILA